MAAHARRLTAHFLNAFSKGMALAKMGSFGKNGMIRSLAARDLYRKRCGDGLATSHALYAFELGHGAEQLTLQLGFVAQNFVQHLAGGQDRRRLQGLSLMFFVFNAALP